ncbi:hypothetical protein ACJJTC_001799 [Scirpophaga incertulas]
MFDPEDPGGTSPQVSSIVTIDCSGMETEGSVLETDCSENASITNKRKRTSARKVCKHCNKRKRRHRDSSSNHDLDCLCENTQGTKLASDEHSEIVHIKPPTSQPQLQNVNNTNYKPTIGRNCYEQRRLGLGEIEFKTRELSVASNLRQSLLAMNNLRNFKGIIQDSASIALIGVEHIAPVIILNALF